ncbi:hypothetical protein Mmc1_1187 [Magnetococcus marinus MC-1]|uniref:Uncharacterized protein n=1 Tax=Magnetococcus marinus (strain ATCC BAA-1437 / JCM 17883 / MC-1) TaxID=156889 RepID=A0L6V5_MAGMM|nr:hypothetical protein [Magnetococcus marinus]ABK43698.1 hypothetical protein Mmc1_1187 [Magnetococcus marinus MC-1]
MNGLGIIPIKPAAPDPQQAVRADMPELSLHLGFRNGRFVGYLRRIETTAPANAYHRFTTSMSGCLEFTYEPEKALGWSKVHQVDDKTLARLSWVGQTPADVGLPAYFWVLRVDEEGHFEEIGGKPWPGANEKEAMASFALHDLEGQTFTTGMDADAILERYRLKLYQDYLDDLMPGEVALDEDQFEMGLATREADPTSMEVEE